MLLSLDCEIETYSSAIIVIRIQSATMGTLAGHLVELCPFYLWDTVHIWILVFEHKEALCFPFLEPDWDKY